MVLAPFFALALHAGFQAPSQDVRTEIRIHGNVLTPDDEVRRLAARAWNADRLRHARRNRHALRPHIASNVSKS